MNELQPDYLLHPTPPSPLDYPIEYFDWLRVNRLSEPAFYFLTGQAGTGKTFQVIRAIEANPRIAKLTASTGIAAVNLGQGITIHSLLKVFNEVSIENSVSKGYVQGILSELKTRYDFIVVDEGCMLNDRFVAQLYSALEEVNRAEGPRLGIILVGDFAQLPPIPYDETHNGQPVMNPKTLSARKKKEIPWLFNNAEVREVLAKHTIKLTEIKRQTDTTFIDGLNLLRAGKGVEAMKFLTAAGVNFVGVQNPDFDGTTLLAVNEEVDRSNKMRLMKHDPSQPIIRIPSWRWWGREMIDPARQPGDWKGIPNEIEMKVGALVMLLANYFDPVTKELVYANGDTGIIESVDRIPRPHTRYKAMSDEELNRLMDQGLLSLNDLNPQHSYLTPFNDIIEWDWTIKVRLKRNGELITVSPIVRQISSASEPPDEHKRHARFPKNSHGKAEPVRDREGNTEWIDGQIRYYPIRLAWYTTVHRSQGLSFDTVQVNISNRFWSNPAMIYTAVSRCRNPKQLFIVGTPTQLALACKASKEIKEYL